MATAVEEVLAAAVKGLLYQSETDAPFQPFAWTDGTGSLPPERVRELSGHRAGDPVKEMRLEEFFSELTASDDWYGEAERATARQYQDLLGVLRQHLADVRVYKVGRVNIDVYVVGRTADGNWAGIRTSAVET